MILRIRDGNIKMWRMLRIRKLQRCSILVGPKTAAPEG